MLDIVDFVTKSEKDLLVGLAGPGTGKSTTFKTIIESGQYAGKNVLILSFINKLVDDLKDDFSSYTNVKVATLHSFAKREYVEKLDREVDLDGSLDKVISEDYFYLTDKKADFELKFHEGVLTADEEVFYRERSKFYRNKNRLHSLNSIIYAVNRLYATYEGKIPTYDLVLIDEFQDFNRLEYNLIDLLNKKSRVIIVGDDDQSLYDWKHAKPELIRDIYNHESSDEFSLDYCYRCTEVIVDAVNDLIVSAQAKGLLKDRANAKKFIYPTVGNEAKHEISKKHSKIDFIHSVSGSKLFYQLADRIKKDVQDNKKKRVLILAPSYFKQNVYDGLVSRGVNVVGFELFSDERRNKVKHSYLIDCFNTLIDRKTDDLALRKLLYLYMNEDEIRIIIQESNRLAKRLWFCLDPEIKVIIENDIRIFSIAKKGGKIGMSPSELVRFDELFNTKNILSKLIRGFNSHTRGGVEVELTTVMSSKGLSADYVYYLGIDDSEMLDKDTLKLTNQKICEFLVGITRAKEKLTLFTFKDDKPSILEFIDPTRINRIDL